MNYQDKIKIISWRKHMVKSAGIFLIILFCTSLTYAQMDRFKEENYTISVSGEDMSLAFAGGLNAPQFSSVNLNEDGLPDLVIFDRLGAAYTPLVNLGGGEYEYAPLYRNFFPRVNDWVLFRDFNGDGEEDIFCNSSGTQGPFGVEIHVASRKTNGDLVYTRYAFPEREYDIIYHESRPGKFTHLYVTPSDIPALDDIDGDGALDIVTFENNSGRVHYYRNTCLDNGKPLDTLQFILEDECWGKFYESDASEEVFLSSNPDECASGFTGPGGNRLRHHSGSTLVTFDEGDDGVKDVILGDLTSRGLLMASNGGTAEKAFMTSQDAGFPSYSKPAEMEIFLAPFLVDVDDDNIKDLLVSPNEGFSIEDDENVLFYKGRIENDTHRFYYVKPDLFVGDMIDMGTGSRPFFVDFNADGLMDFVVGNDNIYIDPNFSDSRLYLFENIGTSATPEYRLRDRDYLDMNRFSGDLNSKTRSFAPCFGDLDGDGDLDFVMGEEGGSLFYAENIAGPGNEMEFGSVKAGYMDIDVGSNSIPFIADVNKDGLGDLIVGKRQVAQNSTGGRCGSMYYFENVGSVGAANFINDIHDPVNDPCFGEQQLDIDKSKFNSSPYAYAFNGDLRFYVGGSFGIKVYGDVAVEKGKEFTLMDPLFGQIFEDEKIHPALANIDDDPFLEMLVGTIRGGFYLFQTDHKVDGSVSTKPIETKTSWDIYPNPTFSTIFIANNKGLATNLYCELIALDGRVVLSEQNIEGALDVNEISAGTYFLKISDGKEVAMKKIVIQH